MLHIHRSPHFDAGVQQDLNHLPSVWYLATRGCWCEPIGVNGQDVNLFACRIDFLDFVRSGFARKSDTV